MSNVKVPIPDEKSHDEPRTFSLGYRHLQFFLLFFTIIMLYGQRTSLSVAIIAMTDESPPNADIPTYPDWANTDTILSAFFWGYIVPQIGAGQLGELFGPKWFLIGTIVLGALFNMLVPVMAASLGETGVIICRIVQGLSQGFLFPSVHNMISRWAPLNERSRVSACVYSGTSLGVVVSMLFTGAVADSDWGWPAVFYLYGGGSMLWAVVLAIFASNSPALHPRITLEEKMYIESGNFVSYDKKEKIPTPWRSLLTSLPVWSIIITGFAHSWGYFTLLTEIPSYMTNIMHFDIESNSQLSALPYVANFILCLCAGPIADKLISNKVLSVGTTRKIMNSFSTVLPAITLFSLSFIDSSQRDLATVVLIVAVGTAGFSYSGSTPNIIDLAPNHAGTVIGITNGASNIASIFGPLSVQFFGSDKKDPMLWRKVFWVAAGIYVVCNAIYVIFGSGEVQKWNDLEEKEEEDGSESKKEKDLKDFA